MPGDDGERGSAEDGGIRRGRGLRLSTGAPPPEEPSSPGPEEPPAPRRGKALSLSTRAPAKITGGTDTLDLDPLPALQYVDLPQGRMAYRAAGEGPPLLLIHGWAASSRYWLAAFPSLAGARTVYALDLPGFGDSLPLPGPPSVAGFAEAVGAFADRLELKGFDVAGHSLGAAVATYLVNARPGRVGRLALTSFGVLHDPAWQVWIAPVQQTARGALQIGHPWLGLWQPLIDLLRPWAAELLKIPPLPETLASWYIHHVPRDPALLREGVVDLLRMDFRTHLACLASVGDPQVAALLSDVRTPTLFITGMYDRVMPPDVVAAAGRLVPDSRLTVLQNCGHVPMIEQPEAYYAALRTFLLS